MRVAPLVFGGLLVWGASAIAGGARPAVRSLRGRKSRKQRYIEAQHKLGGARAARVARAYRDKRKARYEVFREEYKYDLRQRIRKGKRKP